MTSPPPGPPHFGPKFRAALRDLMLWRRDVRRFRTDPLPDADVLGLIDLACSAPSVGNSQPWRFVLVETGARRSAARESFARANRAALDGYDGEARALYARLKLEGLDAAPVHLAVFADEQTERGAGLGRRTMPETLRYSVVGAVHMLWLAARAEGIGVGWVSILDPGRVATILDTPPDWKLIGYLCLGYPEQECDTPTLEQQGWDRRRPSSSVIVQR